MFQQSILQLCGLKTNALISLYNSYPDAARVADTLAYNVQFQKASRPGPTTPGQPGHLSRSQNFCHIGRRFHLS
jgi:hypothetical protein